MSTSAQGEGLQVPKNSVIFRQGDPGNEMFVIAKGRVRLTLGTDGLEKEVAVLGPGEFFGELSLLSEAPRSATAEAVEDATLLAISRDVFAMLVQDDLDIVSRMMSIQGQRLRHTNQPIEELTQRLGRVRIAAHCLRCLRRQNGLPATFDVATLASELDMSPQAVDLTLADLARRGIGALQEHRWSVTTPAETDRLLDVVCLYAEGRAD